MRCCSRVRARRRPPAALAWAVAVVVEVGLFLVPGLVIGELAADAGDRTPVYVGLVVQTALGVLLIKSASRRAAARVGSDIVTG